LTAWRNEPGWLSTHVAESRHESIAPLGFCMNTTAELSQSDAFIARSGTPTFWGLHVDWNGFGPPNLYPAMGWILPKPDGFNPT